MIAIKSYIMKYLPFLSANLLLFVSLTACNEEATPTEFSTIENSNGVFSTETDGTLSNRGIIHNVSVGSPDADLSGPGGDANFSLVANEKSDGTVSGQWQDTFAGGGGGIHVAIDCIKVVDNWAIVGGIITYGTFGGVDVTGQYAITAVVDNGRSKNDPPDQISFSYFPASDFFGTEDCNDLTLNDFTLLDLTKGQVTVK